ncbi:hypothetical protein TanjilG_00318 [Lupinus angustifolius]|uniref:non-reducing end alpha-L-arabinofuranosidase n=1 Tax=Lupinus angustifolius TaxID=3871 RepID=A0A1J7G6Q6_LUPAN|nr:hypothetical protein TanjilG_00318 [Lupinus angustifolius]
MDFYSLKATCHVMLYLIYLLAFHCYADTNQTSILVVNATSNLTPRRIPDTFFGVFLEEINHGVSGGLWAELRNKVALRMEVLCGGTKPCPSSGVGISNPGFWGMNIEQRKKYQIVYYIKALAKLDLQISFTGANSEKLASTNVTVGNTTNWTRMVNILEANASYHNASLQITTTTKGVYWLDQVSAMPMDTYKGNGFRNDLFQMVAELKPKFLRFPGGTFVEGNRLRNAFRWKDTVGPWEERPGHFNDVWDYWTDDGFGYFEGLQLYTNSKDMFQKSSKFDKTSRSGPKAFVSEYAVWKEDAGMGSLVAAVAEAAFLIGLERNSWLPDAIVFDSYQHYGTPSYWVQKLFTESSGAIFLPTTLETNSSNSLIASAINPKQSKDNQNYIRIKVVNFGINSQNLQISVNGLNSTIKQLGSTKTVLTSSNLMDENSFSEKMKIFHFRSTFIA